MNAQLEQRTPEWFAQRKGRITGSRIGAVLGLSKYRTRADVLREMVRDALGAEREFEGNEATEYGSAHEADALAEYERHAGVMIEPCGLVVHPDHDWLAASPDGLVGVAGMVECKCPFRARYTDPSAEYGAQMQAQMACAGRDWCDFAVWRDGEPLAVTRIARDETWLPRMLPQLRAFMDEYYAACVLGDDSPHVQPLERSDAQWNLAASAYLHAKQQAADFDKIADHYRAVLSELAPAGAKGCGVQLIRSERAGTIQYAKIVKALVPANFDFAPYTGKPTTVYTVKESK